VLRSDSHQRVVSPCALRSFPLTRGQEALYSVIAGFRSVGPQRAIGG